jgi:hypothetical protein
MLSSGTLLYGLLLVAALVIGGCVIYAVMMMMEKQKKLAHQGVVKRDWLATGRIDFSTKTSAAEEQPGDFKLLVEERRIVESVAGNENLEIQWRLATLAEAKTVVTQYHKYLAENSLIKSVTEESASPSPATLKPFGRTASSA